jgi:hypothetical protein
MSKYQWIMYLHQNGFGGGMPGELQRVRSIDEARDAFETFCREVYSDDCSATLYAYSDDAWSSAEDFRNVGCPFDYPDRVIERGARGGVKVTRA